MKGKNKKSGLKPLFLFWGMCVWGGKKEGAVKQAFKVEMQHKHLLCG